MTGSIFRTGDRIIMHGKNIVSTNPIRLEPREPSPGVVISAYECSKKLLRERGVDRDEQVPHDLVCVRLDAPDPQTKYIYFIVSPTILTKELKSLED